MRSGKLELETLARVLLITAFLIVILLLFKGCVDGYQQLGSVGIKEYGCWASNLMKANVITLWPSTCRTQIISQETDIKTTGNSMAGCWWQYGKGKWDMGSRTETNNWEDYAKYIATYTNILDSVSTCYAFQPKEEISVNKLRTYMETHNAKGEETKEAKDTLWNYLQKASQGDNICFDKNDKGILKKGEVYYVRFLDDRAAYGTGRKDILGISSNDKFLEGDMLTKEFWSRLFGFESCYDYGKEGAETQGKSESMVNKFVTQIKECKKLAAGEQCSCSEEPYLTTLPKDSAIRAKQELGYASFKTYYKNKQIGNEEKIDGNILERTETSSTRQPKFEKIKGEIVISETEYYVALTKDGDIALSTVPIDPTTYPSCGSEMGRKEKEKKQAETLFTKFIESINECKKLAADGQCSCSEEPYLSDLPRNAEIRATQEGEYTLFKLYYGNKQIDREERLIGELYEGKGKSLAEPTSFEKIKGEMIITEREYYVALLKNNDIVVSPMPIKPLSYPNCESEVQRKEKEKKQAETIFNNFIASALSCATNALQIIEQCSCSEEPYISGLPKNAEIRATQEQENILFKLYYENKQVGNEAKIKGDLFERTEMSSTRQPKFEKIKGGTTLADTDYYTAFLAGNLAVSPAPIDPTTYPNCQQQHEQTSKILSKSREFFSSFIKNIKNCKQLTNGKICRCEEEKIDFVNELPQDAEIRISQGQNELTATLYYKNQPGGSAGEVIEGTMVIQTNPSYLNPTFRQMGESFTFTNERPYYLLLTKNTNEFAISATPINPNYPICS